MKAHPYAELFPLLGETELAALADDIRTHGLREPILVHRDGSILDGRNRFRACKIAGVPAATRTYEGDDAGLLNFVVSLNLHRRHLSESQRAIVAGKIANLRHGERADLADRSIDRSSVTTEQAATLLNVGEKSVRRARQVIEKATPELAAAVESGHLSVNAAQSIVDAPAEVQKQVAEVAATGTVQETRRAVTAARVAIERNPFLAPEPRDPVTGRTAEEQAKVDHKHHLRTSDTVRRTIDQCVNSLAHPAIQKEYATNYIPDPKSGYIEVTPDTIRQAAAALLEFAKVWEEVNAQQD